MKKEVYGRVNKLLVNALITGVNFTVKTIVILYKRRKR